MKKFMLLFLLCGCVSIPEPKEYYAIRHKPAIAGVYDCKHKAIEYLHALKANGWRCQIIIAYLPKYGLGHAFVAYQDKEGKMRYADPTGVLPSGYPIEQYRNIEVLFTTDEGEIISAERRKR